MNRTKSNNSNLVKCILALLLVVFVAAGVFLGIEIWDNNYGKFRGQGVIGDETVVFNGRQYTLNKNIDTFLVMGLDKFNGTASADSYNNDEQADFLMLFVFNNETKEYTTIHIIRDTMTDVNILGVAGNKVDTVKKQIALAHTYGNGKNVSCKNTASAVEGLFKGIEVDHYISLSLDSVATYNDLVGGVEVTVLHDFTGVDSTLIKGENVILKGEHALNYVKERRDVEGSTNAERMERQQQYLEALRVKSLEKIKNDDSFIVNASVEMADYIVSDRSVTQLQEIAKKLEEYTFKGIKDIKGTSKMGEKFIEFYPDEVALEEMVINLFYLQKAH